MNEREREEERGRKREGGREREEERGRQMLKMFAHWIKFAELFQSLFNFRKR